MKSGDFTFSKRPLKRMTYDFGNSGHTMDALADKFSLHAKEEFDLFFFASIKKQQGQSRRRCFGIDVFQDSFRTLFEIVTKTLPGVLLKEAAAFS